MTKKQPSSSSSTDQENTITIETDIDETLTIKDIKKDITECEKMINRTDYKIRLYQNKIKQLQSKDKKTKSLVKKGLNLFNLNKKTYKA